MASRNPNILKIKKQRSKGRRSYLTQKFSGMHVPRRIGTSHIPEDAIPLFKRVYDDWGEDHWLNTIFPGVNSESIGRKFSVSRAEEEKLLAWTEDEELCDYFTMPCGVLLKFRMTFVYNRPKTKCYFIEVHAEEHGGYALRSKEYGSEERAMFDYKHHRISWHEHLPLDSMTLVLPRRE